MSRGRPPRQPSGRNLLLYHELVCEGRPQAELALQFQISQPRVTEIHAHVAAWVDHFLAVCDPGSESTADPARRFHAVIAFRRMQLTAAYGEYLDYFGGPAKAATYRQILDALDAQLLSPGLAAQLPPREFIETAIRMARELEDLASVAHRGPFFDLQAILVKSGCLPGDVPAPEDVTAT